MTSDTGADAPSWLDEVLARRADLRAAVLAQLNGLSPQCRPLLETAALLEESIDLPILADVIGAPETEIATRLPKRAAELFEHAHSAGGRMDIETLSGHFPVPAWPASSTAWRLGR